MKVVLINGSPRANGNTARALKEVAGTLGAEGIETETVWTGNKPVRGCMACYQCKAKNLGKCVFGDDAANTIIEKLKDADGIVVGGSASASRAWNSSRQSPPHPSRCAGAGARRRPTSA